MGSINRKKTQWTEELIIEKLSNIYKEINLRFKLNLVGLDFVTNWVASICYLF